MERRLLNEEPQLCLAKLEFLPLSTGVMPLDRVLAGGIRRGTVTFVEADIEAQGVALLRTVARLVPHTCLVAALGFFTAVTGLLAGSGGVPAVNITDGCLSKTERAALVSGLSALRSQDVLVSSTGSLSALASVARAARADVLIVHDAARYGPPGSFVPRLTELASMCQLAVLTSGLPIGELPDWANEGLTRVLMHGFDLGGRACLVRTDPDDLLAIAQLEVKCLRLCVE